MKLSVDWLREYIDIDCSLDKLAADLTMAGLEVEESKAVTKEQFAAAGGSGSKDDVVWDVKVTPNRGDWLSVLGVARECSPILGKQVKMPKVEISGKKPASSDLINIKIDAPDLCRRYVGIVIRDVKVGESPDWMKDRLIAEGMRPINNIVDITNYVMLELGQPLHAFDYHLLHGKQIIVRRAKPEEVITSLDGEERKLDKDMLVIADADRSVAIAGVMGGADSEISEQTKDILIESANFNSASVRRTAKQLGMVTESSYRFERGVDPSIADFAAKRAAQLINDIAGGEISEGIVDVYPVPVEPLEIVARPEKINGILGTNIKSADMVSFLKGYYIDTAVNGDTLNCKIPTFRSDVTKEIDLAEEVGRGFGYEKLEMTLPAQSLQGMNSQEGYFRDKVRRILMSCGSQEVLTHSLVDSKLAEIAGKEERLIKVRNPLSEENDSMRVALIPNLLQAIQRNQAFGNQDLSVFEIGKIYYKLYEVIDEELSIAGAMVGNQWASAWNLPKDALDVDFFFCKGVVETLLGELGISGAVFEKTNDLLLHPTRAAKIAVNGVEIGMLGEASPAACEKLDVKGRPYVFELNFKSLMQATPEIRVFKGVPRYPALHRHIAVVLPENVGYRDLEKVVLGTGNEIVESVELLDVYTGHPIPEGQSSLTVSIVFRSPDRTLKDDEVNNVLDEIREALKRGLGASFR